MSSYGDDNMLDMPPGWLIEKWENEKKARKQNNGRLPAVAEVVERRPDDPPHPVPPNSRGPYDVSYTL